MCKSAAMCYNGSSGVTDGIAGWEGALLLQVAHSFLVAMMSFVIPGQKRDASARAVMRLTPWWAALRHVGRREVGIMILLPRHITPSMLESVSTNGK